MATNYPGSLDSGTQQPSPSASTEMDDSGFEHDVVHTNHSGAIIALETKVGTGDSNAVADSVLAGTGSGTSGWTTGTLANAISGNAATATALATARTIGGVSFDGTGNINLPGVNTAGNQATSGLAATATALATARAINGVNFDGSAAITVTADANTLSNTTLKSTVVASSLTSVGTLASLQVTGLTAAVGKMVVGQASFTREPWASSTIALGNYGFVGTQGSHATSLSWNYERGTDSGFHSLAVNSFASAGGIDIGNAGIYFRSEGSGYAASAAPAIRMTLTSAGDVGIGTTTPDELLHVEGGTPTLQLSDTDNNTGQGAIQCELLLQGRYHSGTADPNANAYSAAAIKSFKDNTDGSGGGGMSLWTSATGAGGLTQKVTIDKAGNVGIGTTAPSGLLQIGDGSTSGAFRVHANAGSESFRVVTSVVRAKNIVDTTTSTAANVFINSANNTMYRSTSSIKYKSPVEDLDDAYADRVLEMRPVWYRSITGNDPTEHSYYGLIAEEVAAIDPRLVTFGPLANCVCADDPDDPGVTVHTPECSTEPEGVQYDRLIPHLISVAQRQAAQIGQLLSRVTALETV
jgi:hypothetical protein